MRKSAHELTLAALTATNLSLLQCDNSESALLALSDALPHGERAGRDDGEQRRVEPVAAHAAQTPTPTMRAVRQSHPRSRRDFWQTVCGCDGSERLRHGRCAGGSKWSRNGGGGCGSHDCIHPSCRLGRGSRSLRAVGRSRRTHCAVCGIYCRRVLRILIARTLSSSQVTSRRSFVAHSFCKENCISKHSPRKPRSHLQQASFVGGFLSVSLPFDSRRL